MPIEKGFEALTPVPPEEVFEVFSDIETHLPLWSIYESMKLISKNEAEVSLRISGSLYKLRAKLTHIERRAGRTIIIDGKGPIYFHLRLTVEPRGIGSLVSGRIYVKAGFFRERILSPGITEFLDDLKNKIMFQLPSIAEVIRRRKARIKTTTPLVSTSTKKAPVPQQVSQKLPLEEIVISKDPRALSDEILVGIIVLKAELLDVRKFEGNWESIINFSNKIVNEYRNFKSFYIRIKADKEDVKMFIRAGKIVGVRVDIGSEESLNGDEAIDSLKKVEKLSGRAYIFGVPQKVLESVRHS